MRWIIAVALLFILPGTGVFAQKKPPRIVSIRMTVSSGMCFGYCSAELSVKDGEARLLISSAERDKRKCPDLKVTSDISEKHWNSVVTLVERDALFALPDRIGCPGCTDAPIESIEVRFSDKTRKHVAYDVGGAPKELSALSSNLRALDEKLQNELPPISQCR